jgi:hypothetical protein
MRRFVSRYCSCLALATTLMTLGSAFASGLYDGTYHGTLTGAGLNATVCAKKAPVQITVKDGQLEYIHMGHATITAAVAADGSFSGTARNAYSSGLRGTQPQPQTLEGKISGAVIKAKTDVGNSCHYELDLKKF